MSNGVSYDAQMNSADLSEFAEDQEVSERKAVRQAVFSVTRRTTVQGLSASEIHEALQGEQYPDGIQEDQVRRAVGYWDREGRLKKTGFEDDQGRPRFTGEHFWHESKRTRQRLQDNVEEDYEG